MHLGGNRRWVALFKIFGYYTAISRQVDGKSARDNPERYCGWFWVRCSSKKFERIALEAMDVCLRVLKESNKRRFDSYSVWNSVLIISHITFRDRRVHIFADNLSRNSCILKRTVDSVFRVLWLATQSVNTDSPPVPPSERRQTRVSCEQNAFPVCCRNKQRNFTTNQARCSRNTRKRWRSSVWKF